VDLPSSLIQLAVPNAWDVVTTTDGQGFTVALEESGQWNEVTLSPDNQPEDYTIPEVLSDTDFLPATLTVPGGCLPFRGILQCNTGGVTECRSLNKQFTMCSHRKAYST
jgi:hypothetical protein